MINEQLVFPNKVKLWVLVSIRLGLWPFRAHKEEAQWRRAVNNIDVQYCRKPYNFSYELLAVDWREHLLRVSTVTGFAQRKDGTLSGSCSQWPPTNAKHRRGVLRQKQHRLNGEKKNKREKPHDSTVKRNNSSSWDRKSATPGCCQQLRCCSVVKISVWHTYQAAMSHSLASIQGGF